MRLSLYFSILVSLIISTISGCGLQHSSEQVVIGTDTILIDGSSGQVKVFCTIGKGVRTELADTGAAHRMGWMLSKLGTDRLRLATVDVGSFDIYKDGSDWLVVPTGTFLSPSKTKAVKLVTDGGNVVAKIGETEPPYTDIEISEQTVLLATTVDQLSVKWTRSDYAEVLDSSGRKLASLYWKNPATIPIAAPPTQP